MLINSIFSLSKKMFSKTSFLRVIKSQDCVVKNKPFPKQALVFTCLQYKSLKNTVRKGEIVHNTQFLLFPQCFLTIWRPFCHFHQIRDCCLQTLSVWKSLKCVIWERPITIQYPILMH